MFPLSVASTTTSSLILNSCSIKKKNNDDDNHDSDNETSKGSLCSPSFLEKQISKKELNTFSFD